MTKEEYKRLLGYNITTLFTLIPFHNSFHKKYKDFLRNCYSFNKDVVGADGKLSEDFVFIVYEYKSYVEEDIETEFNLHPAFIKKEIAGDFIVITLDKWYYMSQREWEQMQESQYSHFQGNLRRVINRLDKNHFVYSIVNKNKTLQTELSEFIEEDITETNMYWKVFESKYETLILSEITEMTRLSYSKDWILTEIKNASTTDKIIYQKVLNNSIECPSIISLGHEPKETKYPTDFTYLHEILQNKLEELIGKKQLRIEIKGAKYSFLCNAKDLTKKLITVCKAHKLTDLKKVENCLIAHVTRMKAPLVEYYISKDGVSRLASDYADWEEGLDNPTGPKPVVINSKSAFGSV